MINNNTVRILIVILLLCICQSKAKADVITGAATTEKLIELNVQIRELNEYARNTMLQQYKQYEVQKIENEKNWLQRLKEFSENHFYQLQSLEHFVNQLSTQEASLKTLRDGFRVASGFYSSAGILLDLYDAVEDVSNDLGRIKNTAESFKGYRVWTDGQGLNVVNPAIKLVSLADETGGLVYDVFDFVKTQIFNGDNSLSWTDRLNEARKALSKIRGYHSVLDIIIKNMDKELADHKPMGVNHPVIQTLTKEETADAVAGILLGKYGNLDVKAQILEDLDEGRVRNYYANIDNPAVSKETETDPEKVMGVDSKTGRKSTGKAIMNAVFWAITILALLFFGWNFFVVNHGDKQRMDALWKVAAGYVIMAVFTQIVIAMFFS